nr:VWA domain-containing protein [Oscillochloris sp. ZM17-4]
MPLRLLGGQEAEDLRRAVARLAQQLRTRVATRRRRARRGPLDPRATIRASLRYGGVPFAPHHRRRRLRPRLVVLCDLSSSMRALAGLTLSLVYALSDQLSGTRAFAYIDELHDVSADFADARPDRAIATVLARIRADYARTDLGSCLDTFARRHLATVDRRTTVLVLGDGRNNGSDPGLGALRQIRARARHLIWLTPEPQRDWGTGDSDMLAYAPVCSAVHVVGSLRQLGEAVARLFG